MAKSKEPNLVINDVLCYVSTARHQMRRDDIVKVCLTFYSEDKIIKAKDLVFESFGEKPKRRRHENRMLNEVIDLLDILERCDEENFNLPKYVADSYDSLPPTSGFEVIAQSVVSLIDEISTLKREINFLTESRKNEISFNKDNVHIKEDLVIIKGEIRKLNQKLQGDEVRCSSLALMPLSNRFKRGRPSDNDTICVDTANTIDAMNVESDILSKSFGDMDNYCVDVSPLQDNNDVPQAENFSLSTRDSLNIDLLHSIHDEGGSPSVPELTQSTPDIQHGNSISPENGSFKDKTISPNRQIVNQELQEEMSSTLDPHIRTSQRKVSSIDGSSLETVLMRTFQDGGGSPSAPTYSQMLNDSRPRNFSSVNDYDNQKETNSIESALAALRFGTKSKTDDVTNSEGQVDSDGFKLVVNKKKERRMQAGVIGLKKTINQGGLKGAKRSLDLFIGNCDLQVTEDLLKQYILNELNVKIDKCQSLTTQSTVSRAFKVTLNVSDRQKLLNPELWPEDVICRKFFSPRNRE